MIDWFSGYVGYDAEKLDFGRFFEVLPGGEVTRERDRWATAQGSWESGVQITKGMPTPAMLKASDQHGYLCSPRSILRVSGNPVKFLQGHNVTGPSVSKLGPVVQALIRAFDEGFRPSDADDQRLPALHRSRVDVTTAVDLGNHQAVHDWLTLAGSVTRSRHGRAINSSGTVYWGKNSRRWSLKAYCKHCELKAHPPKDQKIITDLLEWSRPQLRIELTLRRPELKIRDTLNESIIWEFMRKLEIPTMESTSMDSADLSNPQRLALQLWLDGHDVKTMYPRKTLYRHRMAIRKALGLDIAMPAVDQVKANPNALLGVEELEKREVITIPKTIQRSLFGAGL